MKYSYLRWYTIPQTRNFIYKRKFIHLQTTILCYNK